MTTGLCVLLAERHVGHSQHSSPESLTQSCSCTSTESIPEGNIPHTGRITPLCWLGESGDIEGTLMTNCDCSHCFNRSPCYPRGHIAQLPYVLTLRKQRLREIKLVAQSQPAGKSRGVMSVPSRMLPKVDSPDTLFRQLTSGTTLAKLLSSLVAGRQLAAFSPHKAAVRIRKGMQRTGFVPLR